VIYLGPHWQARVEHSPSASDSRPATFYETIPDIVLCQRHGKESIEYILLRYKLTVTQWKVHARAKIDIQIVGTDESKGVIEATTMRPPETKKKKEERDSK
jgi:hypothetical protein